MPLNIVQSLLVPGIGQFSVGLTALQLKPQALKRFWVVIGALTRGAVGPMVTELLIILPMGSISSMSLMVVGPELEPAEHKI